jgi:putative addiction module killer protein
LRDGVWELRIHVGAGYRVYFGKKGKTTIILLVGGLKRTQKKDIEKAIEYWKLYKEHHG